MCMYRIGSPKNSILHLFVPSGGPMAISWGLCQYASVQRHGGWCSWKTPMCFPACLLEGNRGPRFTLGWLNL